MEYQARVEGPYTVIALAGEVDLHYSPQAREQILHHLGEQKNLLVDLSMVNYIDSSGVASLVEGYQLARKTGLAFGLVGVSEAVLQVLQLARLDKVFPIHASASERIVSDEQA
ncbi:MAG: STAS domain-containing protein [Pseudomonadota bacterium]|nr:MAG: STAS domain-containing protein [Pseudomonadota bacterium]